MGLAELRKAMSPQSSDADELVDGDHRFLLLLLLPMVMVRRRLQKQCHYCCNGKSYVAGTALEAVVTAVVLEGLTCCCLQCSSSNRSPAQADQPAILRSARSAEHCYKYSITVYVLPYIT